uniref:Ig-like domain-containing protein n=1 Tax=Oryzias latipes TaxID=8090 RepID=A0A3P9MEN1_ORYLA
MVPPPLPGALCGGVHSYLHFVIKLIYCKGEDKVIQPGGEVIAAEGDSLTLNCTFETSAPYPYLFWYKKEVNSYPKYILKLQNPVPGFSFKVSDDKRQMDLQISSAAVTESAVYYCAVRPTVTGNNKTLYKNLQQHNTTKYPLEGVTHCEKIQVCLKLLQIAAFLGFIGTNMILTFRLLSLFS